MANRKPFPDGSAETRVVSCATVAEMVELGVEFGRTIHAGAVVSLEGPLGAGKTHFAKGVVAGLGGEGEVSSPTFTLVHEYGGGRLPVAHFDFYRLEEVGDLLHLGFDDYLDGIGVVLIEWGDRFPDVLPDVLPGDGWRVRIAVEGAGRQVEIERA
ncbi:MAG: tRNA (adenosine(37)-N6)-threonylcarbamoyltransferase complex ATPase subunit type 1 TsaE [Chthoniobacterales bacterium]